MTPAAPSPFCGLTYTVTETSVVSSGVTLTLDSNTSPSIINIPDLTGLVAGTYTFNIDVTSYETIQTSYNLDITISADPCSTATVTVPTQTDPADYSYTGTTTFTAAYIASDPSCSIVYTCVAPVSGIDWCSVGTFNSATGKWTLDTSTLVTAPDKATHPLGTYPIQVTGEISGYASSS